MRLSHLNQDFVRESRLIYKRLPRNSLDLLSGTVDYFSNNLKSDLASISQIEKERITNRADLLGTIGQTSGDILPYMEDLNDKSDKVDYIDNRLDRINAFLKVNRVIRLQLRYPREQIPLDLARQRLDPENGFLCIFERSNQTYRKLSIDDFTRRGIDLRNRESVSWVIAHTAIRTTDLSIVDFIPRQLTGKNGTPIYNGVRYNFPQTEFTLPGLDQRLRVDPETDTFIKLSDDYGALIINRGMKSSAFLLRACQPHELSSHHLEHKRKHKFASLTSSETISRLEEWDVAQFIPPRSNETHQQYARRVTKCSELSHITSIYRELIDQAGFHLQEFDLKQQINFAVYYNNAGDEKRTQLKQFLKDFGAVFFQVFEACEHGQAMGDLILQITHVHGASALPIFEQFNQIMQLVNSGGKSHESAINTIAYYTSVSQRAADLLKSIARLPAGSDLTRHLEEAKQFNTTVIEKGANFAGAAFQTRPQPRKLEEVNEMQSKIEIQTLSGGGHLKSVARSDMLDTSNYQHSEIFGPRDYSMVVANLRMTYGKYDAGWLEYLIDNIGRDLQNPAVKFLLIRDRENKNLIGLIKFRPDPVRPGQYYFGTMYVNPEYQKDFGVGDYLQQMAERELPPNSVYWGSVTPGNVSLERHITRAGGVATEILTEGDENHRSRPLFHVQFRSRYKYLSKEAAFEFNQVKKAASDPVEMERLVGKEKIHILKFDSSPDNLDNFAQFSQNYFSRGYALTRVFYDRFADGKPDQRSTYLVFEKAVVRKSSK